MESFWQRSATVGVVVFVICSVVVGAEVVVVGFVVVVVGADVVVVVFAVVVVFSSVVVLSCGVDPDAVEFAVAGDVVDGTGLAVLSTTEILLSSKVHPFPMLPCVPTKMATMESGVKPDALGITTTVNSTRTDPRLKGKEKGT